MTTETYTAEQYAKDVAEFMSRQRNPKDGSTWCARSDACILGYAHKGLCLQRRLQHHYHSPNRPLCTDCGRPHEDRHGNGRCADCY